MTEMHQILRSVPLFSGLNIEELKKLSEITSNKDYSRRQYVFMEGEPREAVFFIRSGAVKTFKVDEHGNEQIISFLQEGEMFPHVGFFDKSPYPATAEIIQKAALLMIRIDDFDQLLMDQPQIAIKVMKIMGQKLMMLQERIQELSSRDVQHRVVRALIRLTEESGIQHDEGVHIDLPITNKDFANMIGASRETVNRIFNQLKKQNLLETNRQGILIYDIERLKND